MVVKVFGSAAAACPQRVMACLFELGVDFELIHIDFKSLEHKTPEFLRRQVQILIYIHTFIYVVDRDRVYILIF